MTHSSDSLPFNIKCAAELIVFTSSLFDLYLNYRSYSKSKRQTSLPEKFKKIASLNIDQEEYEKTRLYTLDKLTFGLIKSVFETIVTCCLIRFDYFSILWNLLYNKYGGVYRPAFYFVLVEQCRTLLIDTPFSYYYNFVTEKNHGFNKMTLTTFVTDKVKVFILSMIFQIVFFGLMICCMEKYQEKFIMFAWTCAICMCAVYLFLYPNYIAPLFNKFEPLDENNPKEKLVNAELIKMCNELNFPLGKLYKIDGSKRSDHSQAYFFGFLGKKQIVVFDTLIEKVEVPEIVAIVGHELGHWYHQHNVHMIILSFSNIGLILYLFSFILNNDQIYKDFGFVNKSYFMGFNIFFLLYTPIGVIIEAFLCFVIRRNEYQADRFAVRLGKGQDLTNGLLKLFKDNKADLDPDEIYSLFKHTHPNLIDRTDAINQELKKLK